MTDRTRKEFADYIKMDVKKLADKIRYQEKKHNVNFGHEFEDNIIYTEQEQYDICKLLEIPVFTVSVHNNTENFLSELNREKIKNSFEQLSELVTQIDSVDFIRLDKKFYENLLKKLGDDFEIWYEQNNKYNFSSTKYADLNDVQTYLAQRD